MRRLTGLDIRHLVREFAGLQGNIVKKIYFNGDKIFGISIYPGISGRRDLIIDLRGYSFLSERKWSWPQTPPAIAMGLRKRLVGRKILSIKQPRMERIIEFEFSDGTKLIVELFGGGNVILVEDGKIRLVKERASFSDRVLKEGVEYSYPPSRSVDIKDLDDVLEALKGFRGEVWRALANVFGVGPPYIDEICASLEIDPRSPLSDVDLEELAHQIYSLISSESRPTVYLEGGKVVNFSVIPLSTLKGLRVQTVSTLSEAIEMYYLDNAIAQTEDRRVESLRREIERQRSLKGDYLRKAEELRRKGDIIYQNIYHLKGILEAIRSGLSPEGVVSLNRKEHKVVISLGDLNVEMDFLKSPQENAADYYSRAKKLEEKASKIDEVVESLTKRMKELAREVREKTEASKPKKRRKKRWFERFRWFYTSSGKLVLIGRDQQTNNELVSKYLGEDDLFFHVDMPGGAVVVLKAEGEPDEDSIEQAAIAAGVYSKAWREGLSVADVYYVTGKQVSRHAPSGLYIPKGSFYISGKRNYIRVKLVICVGFQEAEGELRLTAAPPGAPMIGRICLSPGFVSKEETSKLLVKLLNKKFERTMYELSANDKSKKETTLINGGVVVTIDDVMRILPSGKFKVLE